MQDYSKDIERYLERRKNRMTQRSIRNYRKRREERLRSRGIDFDSEKNDGGAGSGNFGHEGRPGEIGGSAESGADPIPHKSLSKKSKDLLQKRLDNPYGFGMSSEQKESSRKDLAQSLKDDGAEVTYNEEHDTYTVCVPESTYEEQFEYALALNGSRSLGSVSKEEYTRPRNWCRPFAV